MNRDKQIDEMANIIALKAFEQAHLIDGDENLADIVATDLYEKGYRKASEVAREIITDIDDALHKMATEYANAGHPEYFAVCEMVYHKVIRSIEKKYESEKDNGGI